jgi:lysophospholipase L1-like esterase
MPRTAGPRAVVSMPDGGALTAGDRHDVRPLRATALLMGAAVACLAALALATLAAPTAPSSHPLALRHGLRSHLATSLPITLAPAASASIGTSERSFWPVRHGSSLLTRGAGIHSTFNASGAALRVAQGTIGLSLTGVGRGQSLAPVGAVAPTGSANQVLYRHGSISEFYRNGPYGLEQGFTLRHRPQAGTGSLVLALGLRGSLVPEQVGSQVLFRTHAGATALRYGQLSVLDATGRRLPAQMQFHNGTLQLRIDDSNARYPLRIDPFIQQGSKLTASDEIGQGEFGYSVALSSDGNTALIGGPYDNSGVGAAWVFTRSGSTWTQQGSKLTGGGEIGAGAFGYSVALSSDGNTALIGGVSDSNQVGAAWVFTRSGSTWTQQGSKLTGSGEIGGGAFGHSVALSSDGNTALIGGPYDNSIVGAAWVFTRSGSTWTQQGSKLTGGGEWEGGDFGYSVALSADGNTALIGGPFDSHQVGAAWVFTRSGSTWTQQGSKLTGSAANFGWSVALSADGNTALIGGPFDNTSVGAAWVFTRSGSTWTQQGSKLTGSGESGAGFFGWTVALSGDGNTALIGGRSENGNVGMGWVFTRSGSTWTQQNEKLTGSGSGPSEPGWSVALSADGNTALGGTAEDNSGVGAAWVFTGIGTTPPPTEPTGNTLTVSTLGTGWGTITGPGISCPSACSNTYPDGTVVTLTATPAAGSYFAGWGGTGACRGTATTCEVTMSGGPQSVQAGFTLVPCLPGQVGTPPNCLEGPQGPPDPWYVALGDSFQSGEGANPWGRNKADPQNYNPANGVIYEPGTGGDQGCHRSPDAYARLLQQALGVTTGFFACSGARIADIQAQPPSHYNCDSEPSLFGTQPCKSGEDPQIQHLNSSTRLVTIGVGGNDIGFKDIVESCVLQTIPGSGTCEGKTDELNVLLPAVAKNLYRLYQEIAVWAPHARILVVDYPKIFPDDGTAGGDQCEHLNQEDQLWANALLNHLDDWIAWAVRGSGVAELVDVRNAFKGHGLCSSDPYINHIWLNGKSVKPESFHPNAEGQESFFRFVLAQYKSKVAASARVNVLPGQTATKRVRVPHGTRVVTFSSRWPGSTVSMTLVSPSGRRYTPSTKGVGHASGPTFETYTINHPQPGSWKVRLHGTRVRKGGERVSLGVTPGRPPPGALKRRGKRHTAAAERKG